MKKIYIFLLACWVLLACLTLPYNALKAVSEIKQWGFLTDYQKREKIFGDTFNFVEFIQKHTPTNSSIYIYSREEMIGLLARYYLYPRKLFLTRNTSDADKISNYQQYKYVALYNKKITINNYYIFAVYKSKNSSNFGIIYKRND